ncbi:hypothetical protein DFH06DRAFT_1145727 [Mycena polygramma]|nr:hypothetical protein DFH06DRAFT_1145727 [Mycena polygramma]
MASPVLGPPVAKSNRTWVKRVRCRPHWPVNAMDAQNDHALMIIYEIPCTNCGTICPSVDLVNEWSCSRCSQRHGLSSGDVDNLSSPIRVLSASDDQQIDAGQSDLDAASDGSSYDGEIDEGEGGSNPDSDSAIEELRAEVRALAIEQGVCNAFTALYAKVKEMISEAPEEVERARATALLSFLVQLEWAFHESA